jgi:uncharacterized membrane protein YfcA
MGVMIGALTGFVGAGGGFLIVPALVNGLGLPMNRAMGTSLFIITLNSFSGFAADWFAGAGADWGLIGPFSAASFLGLGAGVGANSRISSDRLKPVFGWFVLIVGGLIMAAQVRAILG